MKTIWKKILPWYFEAVRNGSKTFEIRKDEDGFEVGDHIILCEWSGTAYTGFTFEVEITYILRDAEQYGLVPGFCILGIKALDGKDTNVPTKWIPFTADTMPKEDGEYFVLYDDKYAEDYDTGSVGIADFYGDCEAFGYWQERYDPVSLGFVDSDFIEIKVKKWMPIPKDE